MVGNILIFIVAFILGIGSQLYVQRTLTKQSEVVTTTKKTVPAIALKNAPENALKGDLSASSGTILFQDRIATKPATLLSPVQIQQGETLETTADGKATVKFGTILTTELNSQTKLNYVQTLPENIVINQLTGKATYITATSSPVSIRSLHTVIKIESESVMTIETDDGLIDIEVTKGSIIVGYNDLENISTIVKVKEGYVFRYDDGLRAGEITEI